MTRREFAANRRARTLLALCYAIAVAGRMRLSVRSDSQQFCSAIGCLAAQRAIGSASSLLPADRNPPPWHRLRANLERVSGALACAFGRRDHCRLHGCCGDGSLTSCLFGGVPSPPSSLASLWGPAVDEREKPKGQLESSSDRGCCERPFRDAPCSVQAKSCPALCALVASGFSCPALCALVASGFL